MLYRQPNSTSIVNVFLLECLYIENFITASISIIYRHQHFINSISVIYTGSRCISF